MSEYSSVPGLYSQKLLSRDEERALIKQMHAGDSSARDQLIMLNMRLVASIAKKYTYIPLEDAVMEGAKGLIRGIDRYDLSRGAKISTYVTWWIHQSLRRYTENTSLVHIPAGKRGLLYKIERAARALGPNAGEDDIAARISRETGKKYSADDVKEYRAQGKRAQVHSLDAILLPSEPATDCAQLSSSELFLPDAVEHLPMRERYVIMMRYLRDPTKTLNEVGYNLGITRERVRQIEVKALKRLKLVLGDSSKY